VNSISLQVGEDIFIEPATLLKKHGLPSHWASQVISQNITLAFSRYIQSSISKLTAHTSSRTHKPLNTAANSSLLCSFDVCFICSILCCLRIILQIAEFHLNYIWFFTEIKNYCTLLAASLKGIAPETVQAPV
jgi:hypothetical protein